MKRKYFWILIFLYILFIFSNSLTVGEKSSSISGGLTTYLLNILHQLSIEIEYDTFHHFIRKAAHFTEYAGLGALVYISIQLEPLFKNKTINFLLFWILTPSIDETIQHFIPDRYGCVQDVLLDMCGFITGTIITYFLYKLTHKSAKTD